MPSSLPATLETVLAFENESVVARFAEDFAVSIEDAEEIFYEMKRWLWLCAKRRIDIKNGADPFLLPLFNEAYAIDMMWHVFILFTEDYSAFCSRHFGFFIHHYPKPKSERLAWQTKIQANPEE